MAISELEISCFRNLKSVRLSLNPQFNLLSGPNGAGKTSVLEAVYLLARARSFRGRRIAPLIQHGQPSLLVRAALDTGRSLALQRERNGKIQLHVDQTAVGRLSDAAALLPVQALLPEIGNLVFGGPRQRRQCLDWGMFHVKPSYLRTLRDYLSALRQRNAALKFAGAAGAAGELQTWTDALCRLAQGVHEQRCAYVADLIPHVEATVEELDAGFPIGLSYKCGWGEGEFAKNLSESLDNDVKLGTTSVGPHRADLSLKAADRDADVTLSRGQGKLLATGLILAQTRLLQARTGQQSVFLIDDLGAELDSAHSLRLLALLRASGCQVVATTTRAPDNSINAEFASDSMSMFHVEQGAVRPVEEPESLEPALQPPDPTFS